MVSNTITFILSILALFVYGLYALSSQGVFGLLVSIAIALITAAFVDKIEYIAIGVLVVGLTYIMAVRKYNCKFEGFGNEEADILALNNALTKKIPLEKRKNPVIKGTLNTLYGSSMEAFEDAPHAEEEEEDEEDAPATSTPATVMDVANPNTQTNQDAAAVQATMKAPQVPPPATGASPVAQPSSASTAAPDADTSMQQGFQDEETSGLFKLGHLPSEAAAGPFVDVASTMSKAMGALKPDQIAAMTAESKSLLETQQNLMQMLESMRPVLQDGRQLLDTFGSIFGGMGTLGMK